MKGKTPEKVLQQLGSAYKESVSNNKSLQEKVKELNRIVASHDLRVEEAKDDQAAHQKEIQKLVAQNNALTARIQELNDKLEGIVADPSLAPSFHPENDVVAQRWKAFGIDLFEEKKMSDAGDGRHPTFASENADPLQRDAILVLLYNQMRKGRLFNPETNQFEDHNFAGKRVEPPKKSVDHEDADIPF